MLENKNEIDCILKNDQLKEDCVHCYYIKFEYNNEVNYNNKIDKEIDSEDDRIKNNDNDNLQ